MGTSTEDLLRATVAALLRATGESQGDLASGLGLSQAQVSRKLAGRCGWAVADLDRLSTHYGIAVVDLVVGPTHALRLLPDKRRAAVVGGTQTVITL
ncbi:helix-turn-helix domain-containing protein [Kitasatospora sp. NPDC059327]|uniref:helix-turn-helix domain-containing protein n=1 Tax=Kitasatospora sp. NPDC059327 TaxID=3346803 RepID=UPI0036AF5655